jgi:hypothetical protein
MLRFIIALSQLAGNASAQLGWTRGATITRWHEYFTRLLLLTRATKLITLAHVHPFTDGAVDWGWAAHKPYNNPYNNNNK